MRRLVLVAVLLLAGCEAPKVTCPFPNPMHFGFAACMAVYGS